MVLLFDTLTKVWALQMLVERPFALFSLGGIDAELALATNKGAAWGIGSSWPLGLLFLRLTLIGAIGVYLFGKYCPAAWRVPLALALGAAISNVKDYFLWGHVIDMIHITFWGYDYPIFNLADSVICCAVVYMLFKSK